jgi:hypothetical protein
MSARSARLGLHPRLDNRISGLFAHVLFRESNHEGRRRRAENDQDRSFLSAPAAPSAINCFLLVLSMVSLS